MLAAALLSLAVDAPTTADGWVRVINIKPSDGSCPGDLQHTVPPSGRAVCERGCTSSRNHLRPSQNLQKLPFYCQKGKKLPKKGNFKSIFPFRF